MNLIPKVHVPIQPNPKIIGNVSRLNLTGGIFTIQQHLFSFGLNIYKFCFSARLLRIVSGSDSYPFQSFSLFGMSERNPWEKWYFSKVVKDNPRKNQRRGWKRSPYNLSCFTKFFSHWNYSPSHTCFNDQNSWGCDQSNQMFSQTVKRSSLTRSLSFRFCFSSRLSFDIDGQR